MEYTYKATKEDIKTIEEGINTVFDSKLSFIFKDKTALKKFLIISYDSRKIYCWTTEHLDYKISSSFILPSKILVYHYIIPHKIYIPIQNRTGWYASIFLDGLDSIIPKELLDDISFPKMSGSLLGDFIATQKELKGTDNNPYVFRDGYLATIIHEFGHIYYNQTSPSVKTRSLKFLEQAEQLYSGKIPDDLINPFIPYISPTDLFYLFGETYATCAELYASSVFYPEHEKRFTSFSLIFIQYLLQELHTKNVSFDALDFQYSHTVAAAIGKIFMTFYSSDWPEIIINYPSYWPRNRFN